MTDVAAGSEHASLRNGARAPGRAADLVLQVGFRAFYVVFSVILRLLVFVKRDGPYLTRGPVILAPNHCSFMDPVVLQMATWRQISYMMTEVYYNPASVRWIFQLFRAIPVKEGSTNRSALEAAEDALRRGWVVCIFPEGGISRDGALQRFHPGVAALSLATGARVVPVSIAGTFEAYPRHRRLPRLFRPVSVRFGEPMAPLPDESGESRKEVLRGFTERIRGAVASLAAENH